MHTMFPHDKQFYITQCSKHANACLTHDNMRLSKYNLEDYPHFTAFLVHKTYNSTVALQVGFLKHRGDVATVLLDLVCLSLFCFFMSLQIGWMMMRSDLCVEHWLLSDSLCKLLMVKLMFGNVN